MHYFSFKRSHLAIAYCDNLEGKGIINARSGLFLAAPRRVGKSTFLVEELIPEAEKRSWLPIYIDLWSNKTANPADLIAEAIKVKFLSYEGKISKLVKAAKVDKINILGALQLDFTKSGFPSSVTLADALSTLSELAQKPIMLVIDEAQHSLVSPEGINAMFAIKSARDQLNRASEQPKLMLVFTGSNRDKLAHLLLKKDQAFFGSEITSFPLLNKDYSDNFTDWVNKNLAANNQFHKEGMWRAFKLVGHKPEILRNIAGRIALSGDASNFSDILEKDALTWKNRIWDEFENDFTSLTSLQKAILETMINKNDIWMPFSEEAIAMYKQITGGAEIAIPTVQTAIQSLREKGFIWQSGRGAYALEDESFAEWFRHRFLGKTHAS